VLLGVAAVAAAAVALVVLLREPGEDLGPLRAQDFSREPGWEGLNNRSIERCPSTRQAFGWSDTAFGGAGRGEVGGIVTRAVTPGWYGKAVEESFERPFAATGRLLVRSVGTQALPSGGVMLGFFHSSVREWRPASSLVLRLDSDSAGPGRYAVALEYSSRNYRAGGAVLEGPDGRPAGLDVGRAYSFALAYDPAAGGGRGQAQLTIPDTGASLRVRLERAARREGARLDRFGLTFPMNGRGKEMEVYVSDLRLDGVPQPLGRDPGWPGEGNRVEGQECRTARTNDFGWTGSADGRAGGMIARTDERLAAERAFYGDRVGRLTLEDRLHARGTIMLERANSDSAALVGFFDAAQTGRGRAERAPPSFLGLSIGGPSRIGQYAGALVSDRRGRLRDPDDARVIFNPGPRSRRFRLDYEPDAGVAGRLTLELEGRRLRVDLRPIQRRTGAVFDRFGIRNVERGGSFQVVHLDDLRYSVAARTRRAR